MTELKIEYVGEYSLDEKPFLQSDIPVVRLEQVQAWLTEAVWAMGVVRDVSLEHYGSDSEIYKHAAAFLDRPDVRERQARQKEAT